MGYSYRKKDEMLDALRLISRFRREREASLQGAATPGMISHGFVFKTPSGGIPAQDANVCGKAKCKAMFINGSDELKEFADDREWTVYNVFTSAIAGDTIITAKKLYGKLVADAENCP